MLYIIERNYFDFCNLMRKDQIMEKLSEEKLKMVAGGVPRVFSEDYYPTFDEHANEWTNRCRDCNTYWYTQSAEYVCPNCQSNNIGHAPPEGTL